MTANRLRSLLYSYPRLTASPRMRTRIDVALASRRGLRASRPTALTLLVALGLAVAMMRRARAESGDDPAREMTGGGSARPGSASAEAGHADPSVESICRAAVALALAEPARAKGFVDRARAAGWLPELRFRVYRRFARTEGLTFDDTGTGAIAPVDISAVDDVRYEWRATWDLSRMVFSPDEVQAHVEGLRMAEVRRDIQTMIIRMYFERRRLLIERPGAASGTSSTEADVRAIETRSLRIAEIEAELDALSGGAFSGPGAARPVGAAAP